MILMLKKKLILEVYRFNRIIFGVNASPFLLAVTVKHHIEKYLENSPTAVQHLNSFMYVGDWITGQTFEKKHFLFFIAKRTSRIKQEWL